MKKLTTLFISCILLSPVTASNRIIVNKLKSKPCKVNIDYSSFNSLRRSPSNSSIPVSLLYDHIYKELTVVFHKQINNANIIILQNGEEISNGVFDMEENEGIEYDLSECGTGEFSVYADIDGCLQLINTFIISE